MEDLGCFEFVPFFVVYRYKDNPFDHSFYCQSFKTLRRLYAFIGNNIERWDYYKVGRCLESYTL